MKQSRSTIINCMKFLTPNFPDNKISSGGYGIYFSSNGKLYHALDIQITSKQSSVHPSPKTFKRKQKRNYKYFQNYESSVYVKPPSGAIYKTHKLTSHIDKVGAISYKIPKSLKECLFQPYISWHGGKEAYDENGLISMRGFDLRGKRSHLLNQKPTLGKGELAARYYMFANVIFPLDITNFPSVKRENVTDLETVESFDDTFTDSKRIEGYKNLVVSVDDNFNGGICLYLFIHGLGLIHASRFDEQEKRLWKTKPITLNPTLEAPLGVSLVFMDDGGVVSKETNAAIFIANSTKSNTDMSFAIQRTSTLENIRIKLSRLVAKIIK